MITVIKIIQNPWFVGIVGGIISSLVVFLITNKFFSGKSKKEFLLSVNKANEEIINELKPYITDIGLPDVSILNALCNSTARKYNVPFDSLNPVNIICEDLIKEINDNVFINDSQKESYMSRLIEYSFNWQEKFSKEKLKEYNQSINSIERAEIEHESRNNSIKLLSLTMSIMTFAFSILFTSMPFEGIYFSNHDAESIFMIAAFCIIMLMSLTISMLLLYKFKKTSNKKFKKTKKRKQK